MIIIKQKSKDHCEMKSLQIPCASLGTQYGRTVLQVSCAVLVDSWCRHNRKKKETGKEIEVEMEYE